MKIYKTKVYDLNNAMIASGYPMKSEYKEVAEEDLMTTDIGRAIKLAKNPSASGHCNFLKGILVSVDIDASTKWWIQANRYSHFTIVSSMSTMHRALSMPIEKICPGVPRGYVDIVLEAREKCKAGEMDLEEFVMMLPAALSYTARVTTNYLQLRTMYNQRRTHKLSEWKQFCIWCELLPYAEEFIIVDHHKES